MMITDTSPYELTSPRRRVNPSTMKCLASSLLVAAAASHAPPFFSLSDSSFGLGFGGWVNPLPLEVQIVSRDGAIVWARGAYSSVDGQSANGTVVSQNGSVFYFQDTISNVSGGFSVARAVKVVSVGTGEYAFATQFSLPAPATLSAVKRKLFIPGVSYENSTALSAGALAGDPNAVRVLVREDRLPLPLVAVVYPTAAVGVALLTHVDPDGSTLPNEDFTARIVDERLQFGSIGVLNDAPGGAALSVAFQYPGSEGDRTYVYDASAGWANRSHPIVAGFSQHSYTVRFTWQAAADATGSFAANAKRAWRDVFSLFAPRVPPSPTTAQLFRDGADLLASVAVEYDGVPSVPFEASLPDGAIIDTSSQMGFVGRALPSAAILLFDAVVVAPNATRQKQAEAVVDVWAQQAMTPCGVPRTWFNIVNGAVQWRTEPAAYHGSLRIMCDGMLGMLKAWSVVPRAEWLVAAVAFGDFLVSAQNADGSVATAWSTTCVSLNNDTRTTAFVVPFLVSLFNATGDARYRAAALAAGDFAAALTTNNFVYVGGAVDNNNVPDKESGWLALQAFVALFELTGDPSWLAPADQAAAYTESFVYIWDVPLPCVQTPSNAYPCKRTTLGASLIATGQSGADNFMSIASAAYEKLGAWLEDAHYVEFAAFIRAATTQTVDWDGSLGYAARGLQNEAFTLSVRRGAGVFDWLPWLTANQIEDLNGL